jgi:hypothetical protein
MPNSYLVVEGLIAAGRDSTVINLSRSVQLSNVNTRNPEAGAKIMVEDRQGASYILPEVYTGRYGGDYDE